MQLALTQMHEVSGWQTCLQPQSFAWREAAESYNHNYLLTLSEQKTGHTTGGGYGAMQLALTQMHEVSGQISVFSPILSLGKSRQRVMLILDLV